MAKGSTSSFVTGMLRYIHLVHGNKEAAEPLLVHSLGKNPNSYLTRYSLAEFYLAEHRCEEGEPHVNWLFDFLEDEAEKVFTCDYLSGMLRESAYARGRTELAAISLNCCSQTKDGPMAKSRRRTHKQSRSLMERNSATLTQVTEYDQELKIDLAT